MLVWIVFGTEPVAVFSSLARAEAFVAQAGASSAWRITKARVNPAAFAVLDHQALPGEAASSCMQ